MPTKRQLRHCWCFVGAVLVESYFCRYRLCQNLFASFEKVCSLDPKKCEEESFPAYLLCEHSTKSFFLNDHHHWNLCCVTRALETHLHNWWIIPPLLWERSHPVLLLSVKSTSQKKILHFYYRAQSWFWEWKSRIADDWLDWAQVSWDLKGFDPKKGRFSRMTNKKERFSLICLLSKLYFLFHILLMHYYMEQLLLLLLPCVVLLCLLSFH